MNAPKKQKPQAEEPAAKPPADTNAAADPGNAILQALAEVPGVTVPGTLEFRPDDAHPGAAIVATADAQLEAASAPQGNARALRRVEHNGTLYGPGEAAGDLLDLNPSQVAALESTGAVTAI